MKVLKMQQGGMITAPDPRPYRAPLQGLDLNAFRYNLNTKPLDTSGMVKVLQFNENADIKRQQQAVLLEQAKIRKEIEEAKLNFQKEKFAFEMIQEVNKASKAVGGPTVGTKGEIFTPDLSYTPFYKKNFEQPLAKIAEYEGALDKLKSDPYSMEGLNKKVSLIKQIAFERGRMASDFGMNVETKMGQQLDRILSKDPKLITKDVGVNTFVLDNILRERDMFFNGLKGSWWEFGSPANMSPHLLFDKKMESKSYGDLLTGFLTPSKNDTLNFKKTGPGNVAVKTETEKITADLNTVVNNMTEAIASNLKMASWFSEQNGVNIFDSRNQVNKELLKEVLDQTIKPQYEAAMSSLQGSDITVQALASDNVTKRSESFFTGNYNTSRSSTFNAEYLKKGGFEDKKTVENFNNFTDNQQESFKSILDDLENVYEIDLRTNAAKKVIKAIIDKGNPNTIDAEDIANEILAIQEKEKVGNKKAASKKAEDKFGLNKPVEELFNSSAPTQAAPSKKKSALELAEIELAKLKNKK